MKEYLLLLFVITIVHPICGQVKPAYNGQEDNGAINQEQAQSIYGKSKVLPNGSQIAMAIIKNGKVDFYGV